LLKNKHLSPKKTLFDLCKKLLFVEAGSASNLATKPFNIDVVVATVAKLLEMGRTSGEPGSDDSE